MDGIHDPFLVGASVVVAILASFTALDLARSVTSSRDRNRRLWLAGGSLAMGFGIWSMHFIAMLAFAMPGVLIAYDAPLLVLSIVVAVLASGIALWVASHQQPTLRYFVYGGLAMGAAISGMHYIGMAGLHMDARIEWRWVFVLASVLIAIAASFAALWLAFRFRAVSTAAGHGYRLGAAVVMGSAIVGMHYTAMLAADFIPTGAAIQFTGSDLLATDDLGLAVIGSTLLILTVALVGSIVERALGRRSAVAEEMARLYADAQLEIGERIRAESALREQDERLRLALDAGGMGMWEWDRAAGRLVMSTPCSQMHNLPDDFAGDRARIESAIHPEDRDKLRASLDGLISDGTPYDAEYRIPHPDGTTRWIRSRGRSYDDARHGPRTIGVCLDVTPQHAMAEQLRQSQKLEAIGHLAGGIAHDFNNVLTAVQGHSELLLDSISVNDPRRADVEEIRRAALRATNLTRQLLAFARRQMLQPVALDLATLVAEMEPMLRRLIGADIRLVSSFATGETPVRADPTQIQQIVLNLVVNARDAMPEGGVLQVQVGSVEIDTALRAVTEQIEPGRYAVITVSDNGTGIPPAVQERIFDPFYTTKPQGKGTGLGLSTVHGIVAQAGGAVRLSSREGAGSSFQVFLPWCAADCDELHPVDILAARGISAKASAASILVVEDEASVGRLVQRVLRQKGYHVALAGSGSEALDRFAGDGWDLLITDVVMPGMSGRELVDRVRDVTPGQRVLFMSGYTEDAVMRQGIDEAEVDFLQKPFTPDTLTDRVAAALVRPWAGH